MGKKWM